MGRDVVKAKFWVEVEGLPDDVAVVLERVASVVANAGLGDDSEPIPDVVPTAPPDTPDVER